MKAIEFQSGFDSELEPQNPGKSAEMAAHLRRTSNNSPKDSNSLGVDGVRVGSGRPSIRPENARINALIIRQNTRSWPFTCSLVYFGVGQK